METKKIAIVTGGGSGIGFAIAKKLISDNNCHVIIIGRNKEKLLKASSSLGSECDFIQYDLSELSGISKLVDGIIENFGKIDILVNNAGIHEKKDILEVTDEDFERIIKVNEQAVFAITRDVAKSMVKYGAGVIVNISSMATFYGLAKTVAYTASKSAIEGMTKCMAVELSPKGVRINCVAPGFISTDITALSLGKDPERKAKVLQRTPMGKLGEPEDIANGVSFLCSDKASYITGIVLPIDGGNSIGF